MPYIWVTCHYGILYHYIFTWGIYIWSCRRYGIQTSCQVTLRTQTNVASSTIVDVLAILAQQRLDLLGRYSHLHAICSRSGVVLCHAEQYRARRSQLSLYLYWELVIIVQCHADRLVVCEQVGHIHLVPHILISLQFVAALPVKHLCIGTSIVSLHIDAECEWMICGQLEHQLGHIWIDVLANQLEELAWNTHSELTVVNWLAKHCCRNLSFCLGQNTIFAIYCHTRRQGDGVCAQVLKCEARHLAHICQQRVGELIPCSTWFVDIFLARHYLHMIDAIQWLCHSSID